MLDEFGKLEVRIVIIPNSAKTGDFGQRAIDEGLVGNDLDLLTRQQCVAGHGPILNRDHPRWDPRFGGTA